MAKIILDAGHGGYDNGASYEGRLEKDDNLRLALAVGQKLEEQGIPVEYTRVEDIYQSPNEKANIGNRSGADYFVSFHRNSSPVPGQYSGVQTLVYADEGIPKILADNINEELEQVGFHNLGISVRPNLAVLRGTQMPAVLIETGFINNPIDNGLFDQSFDEIASGIAQAILRSQGQTVAKRQEYRVEFGRFGHEQNAEALARVLQEEGVSSYISREEPDFVVCHGRFPDLETALKREEELYGRGYETRLSIFSGKMV